MRIVQIMFWLAACSGAGADPKGLGIFNPIAGINGGACAYTSVAQAVAEAASGDTIIIEAGQHAGLIGEIDIDLTLVPGRPGPPGNTGCERENVGAAVGTVQLSGDGGSDDAVGGLVEVLDGARVTFRNLTLRSATATNGGILAVTNGAEVTLDGVRVFDGEATVSGGLVYVAGGAAQSRLRVTGSSNLAAGRADPGDGGGIALFDASLRVEDSTIGLVGMPLSGAVGDGIGVFGGSPGGGNQADGDGGGIYASGSTLSFRDGSRVTENRASNEGGGIFAVNSTITATGLTVRGNAADSSGGGLSLRDGSASFTDGTFFENATTTFGGGIGGGGIYAASDASLQLIGVMMEQNSSEGEGGAVRLAESQMTSNSSVFADNQALIGGAIAGVSGAIGIEGGTLSNNVALGNGGAIASTGSIVSVGGAARFEMNAGADGGAIYQSSVSGSDQLILDQVMLVNNVASDPLGIGGRGGAIFSGPGSVEIHHSQFESNTAGEFGGAVYLRDPNQRGLAVTISNTVFESNQASEGGLTEGGGAIAAFDLTSLQIADTRFLLNTAASSGGALRMEGVQAGLLSNVRFETNVSTWGGAIYSRDSSFDISTRFSTCNPFALAADDHCTAFVTNNANESGGAIFIDDVESPGIITLSQVALLGNSANNSSAGTGTAIAGRSAVPASLTLQDVLVADNGADGTEASAIAVSDSQQLTLRHVTMAGNEARPLWAGGPDVGVEIRASIIYLNGLGPLVSNNVSSFVRSCNNSQTPDSGGQSMGGNLGSPNFTTTARGNYRLSAASVSADQCDTTSPRDLDGLFRAGPDLADQGAFERDGLAAGPDPLFSDGFEGP